MRDLFTISVFTIMQTIKKKSFIISNIIIAMIVIIVFIVLGQYLEDLSNSMKKMPEVNGTPVVLLDNTGTFNKYMYDINTEPYVFILISDEMIEEAKQGDVEENKNKIEADKELKDISPDLSLEENVNFEEISNEIIQAICDEKLQYAILVEKNVEDGENPFSLRFLCNKKKDLDETETLLLTNMLESIYKRNIIKDYKIDTSKIDFKTSYSIEELNTKKQMIEGTYIIALFVSVLLYLAIYLYGHSIASSISSEKMSRIIETLVTSTKPRLIVLGKTLGMGILGILQLLFLLFVAVISYKNFFPKNLDIVSEFIGTVNISHTSIVFLFVFFMLGYLLYAFASAVVGAMIGKPEDVQIANMPLSMLSLLSFYMALFTINIPQTSLSKFASYFPFSAAFAIPAKLLAGYIDITEAYLGMAFLALTVVFVAFCAIRIYSNVILNYGNKVKFRDLFNVFLKIQ